MRGKITIFIDGNNLFHAARAVGVEIDYAKLLNFLRGNSDLLRAFFYTGVDEKAERQQGFLLWMRRNGYRVVEKELKTYADGTKKANLDVEIAVDMLSLADKYDTAVLVSGDEDFAYAINAVAYKGVRVELAGFRANTSPRLIDVADQFIELDSHVEEITKLDGRHSYNGHHSGHLNTGHLNNHLNSSHLNSSHLHTQSQSAPFSNNQMNNGHGQTDHLNNGHINNGQIPRDSFPEKPSAITQPLSSETLMRIMDEPRIKTSVSERREVKSVVESCEVQRLGDAVEVKSFLETQEIKTVEIAAALESCEVTIIEEVQEINCDQTVIEKRFEPASEPFTRISDEGS
jgi:uncharacterized LabA/DUF88 family protein